MNSTGKETEELARLYYHVSTDERKAHHAFVLRNIDALTELLAGEQYNRQWQVPAGCVDALPDITAHQHRGGGAFTCIFERIETGDRSLGDGSGDRSVAGLSADARETAPCPCDDPLGDSTDPMDAVMAVVLAGPDASGSEHYFGHYWRKVVAALREAAGAWPEIATLDVDELYKLCSGLDTDREYGAIGRNRLERLANALDYFADHRYLDVPTLVDLQQLLYPYLIEFFEDAPGIDEHSARWLLLVALDKPVWPADTATDRLLANLGLIEPGEIGEALRRPALEEALTPRQLLALHKTIAAHVRYAGATACDDRCAIKKFLLTYRSRQQDRMAARNGPVAVDLFSGAGGFSAGLVDAGYRIALAVDNNEDALDTYRLNHPGIPHSCIRCADVGAIADERTYLARIAGDVDVVVGGPPCQAFSRAGSRDTRPSGDLGIFEDPRAELYQQYIRVLSELEPDWFVMENVDGLLGTVESSPSDGVNSGATEKDLTKETGSATENGDSNCDSEDGSSGGKHRVIDVVLNAFDKYGYRCDYRRLDCSRFGVAQNRERIIVAGIHRTAIPGDVAAHVERFFDDLEDRTGTDDSDVSLAAGLSNLPRLRRGEGARVTAYRRPGTSSNYVRIHDLGTGIRVTPNHRTREHPRKKDRELFEKVMEPGDTGWTVKYRKGRSDLIDYPVGTADEPAFQDKYRMLDWREPSPTIMAHLAKDSNDFVLPDYYQHVRDVPEKADDRRCRGITPREAARLQSFPDHHMFLGSFTSQFVQIGNAIPPVLAEHIGTVLHDHLRDIDFVVSPAVDLLSESTVESDD